MCSEFTIQIATSRDIERLLPLAIKTFTDTFAPYNEADNMRMYVDENLTPDKLKREFSEPGTTFILAKDKEREIGYAKVRIGNSEGDLRANKPIEISRIYCDESYQGKGVGKLLMQYCLDIGKAEHCDVAWLGVWELNEKAIAFYENWGFERYGKYTFMMGDDAQTDYLMKRTIEKH